ncbi:MAG: penicillin-binding protein 2 [Nitrospinae bacterium]|nr:penicillin-binding protein 2 [Nitrospinota bacterium]
MTDMRDLNGEAATPRTAKYKKLRLLITTLLVFFGFVAVLGRLFYVQLVDYKRYTEYSRNQYSQRINFSATRGRILDRNQVPLALTVPMKSVFASPSMVDNRSTTAILLAHDLGLDPEAVRAKLEKKGHFAWIKRKVTEEQFLAVKSRHFRGVSFVGEDRRFYPQKGLAARLVGYCGLDNNGLAGLEYLYDRTLAGEQVTIIAQKDAMGKIYGYNGEKAPESNFELVATLDSNMQFLAEKALRNVVARYQPKAAIAIVMDVHKGDVLAAAELPEMDSNDYLAYPMAMHRPMSVTQNFEPGSTFKVFVAAAAIEEGLTTPEEMFDCENGQYTLYDKVIREAQGHKYGVMPLKEVIAHSSNIGMIKVAQKLGERRLYDYMRRFGFGKRTGIDLPGEVNGSLRDYHSWSALSLPSISFGQEINVTPMQLATALSVLGNGGMAVRPHLLKQVLKDGKVVMEYESPEPRRIVSRDTAEKVVGMMRFAVTNGTGKLAEVPGFQVAGKTGTAQKYYSDRGAYAADKVMSSFAALFPAQQPRFSVLVMVDEPVGSGWGGEVAAPAAKEIIAGIARYYGMPAEGQRRYEVDWKAVRRAVGAPAKPDGVSASAEKPGGVL